MFTFGAGSYGQLGHGSCDDVITPRQVMELSGSEVTQIACGRYAAVVMCCQQDHLNLCASALHLL